MQKSSIVHIIYPFRPNLGIDTVRAGFAKFPIVLLIWTLMKLSVLGVYPTFCCWATRRLKYEPNCKLISIQLSSDFNQLRATDAYKSFFAAFAKKIWDYVWLASIILYLTFLFILPTKALLDNDLPFASSTIILMEQVSIFYSNCHWLIKSCEVKSFSRNLI